MPPGGFRTLRMGANQLTRSCWRASATASVQLEGPRLERTLLTWNLTVERLTILERGRLWGGEAEIVLADLIVKIH